MLYNIYREYENPSDPEDLGWLDCRWNLAGSHLLGGGRRIGAKLVVSEGQHGRCPVDGMANAETVLVGASCDVNILDASNHAFTQLVFHAAVWIVSRGRSRWYNNCGVIKS